MTALPGIALADWRSAGQTFSFNGHGIRYWTAGQGEPLLLIHGFPTASWDWHYLWAALAERYQVIACDMLGFGDSAKPRGHAYSLLEQADLQQALLAHLGIGQPVHVLAHDYGDSVAQELLARHRARTTRQLCLSQWRAVSRNPPSGIGAEAATQPHRPADWPVIQPPEAGAEFCQSVRPTDPAQ